MGNSHEKVSRAAAERRAADQHQAVCQFLNEEGTRDRLLRGLRGGQTESTELVLLKKLLDSRQAVPLKELTKATSRTGSAVSAAAVRLNRYLEDFSRKLAGFARTGIVFAIPRRKGRGGLSIGYYLACFDQKEQGYLDGISTTRLLLRQRALQGDIGRFRYLRPIEEVLEIGVVREPKWFRKKGPVAVDFDDDRVYRREERLRELRAMVMNNAVSILEGVAATGKTVLALTFAYDLYKADEGPIYYFDCDKKRDFDESILVNEIRSTKGIFILENAHLAPEKSQSIFSTCKHDDGKNILFTCRPTFKEYQYSRGEDLTQITGLTLKPFEDVDKLIRKFSEHDCTPEIPAELQEQIKDVCADSLWLVSYALEGCAKTSGAGDASTWMEAGLKDDLNDLKNVKSAFPEVLVALAPLYRNEVLTAEDYLTNKLGFDYDLLNELVQRGEITSQTTADGVVFYGLPHSGLANAYWEHGQVYKKRRGLPKYEVFVYEYAASNSGNALEAVLKAGEGARDYALERLCGAKMIPQIIRCEIEPSVITLFLEEYCSEMQRGEFLEVLTSRVENSQDMINAGWWVQCIYEAGHQRQFWKIIDQDRLADRLSSCIDIGHTADFIGILRKIDNKAARRLWSKMDLNKYAARITEWPRAWEWLECIRSTFYRDGKAGLKLWRLLDKDILAENLSRDSDVSSAMQSLSRIHLLNPDVSRELCERLDWEALADRIKVLHHIMLVNSTLSGLSYVDDSFASRLCEHMDLEALAVKISEV